MRDIDGLSGVRTDQHDVAKTTQPKKKVKKAKRPSNPTNIVPDDQISDALSAIPNYKLERIYYSLVSLTTRDHTPLLSVGAWSFFETLTAASGRNESVDFYAYLSKQKLNGMDLKSNQKSIRETIKRLADFGNTTKHDPTSAAFNYEQLINDFETVKELIVLLANEAKSKR